MASTGPLSPGAGANAGSGTAWSNPGRIVASDNSRASASLNFSTSQYLRGSSLSASVPDGVTIHGVLVEWELRSPGGPLSLFVNEVALYGASGVIGTAKFPNDDVENTDDAYFPYGGDSDLWGATLSSAIVNASGFGAAVKINTTGFGARTVECDHLRVTIYYEDPLQEVGLQHITSSAQVFTPGVSPGGVVAGMQHIPSAEQLHAPAAVPGSVTIAANHISSDAEAHEPAVETAWLIGLEHIPETGMVRQPGLRWDQQVASNHIESAAATHLPGVTYLQVAGMQAVASTLQLYALGIVAGGVSVGLDSISSTTDLFTFDIEVGGVVVGMQHIAGEPMVYLHVLSVGPRKSSIPNVSLRRREPRFYLALYEPLGNGGANRRLDLIDINADITGLSWQSTWPGGFSQLSVGYDHNEGRADRQLSNPLIPRDLMMRDYARVALTDGGLLLWEGRLGEMNLRPEQRRTLVAKGYGFTALGDMPWLTDIETQSTSGPVLRAAIASVAPVIRPAAGDLFWDPQVTHSPSDWSGFYVSQMLDQIHKEGSLDRYLMDWGVWEDRMLVLLPRIPPSIPDYWVPYDSRYVSDWRRIPPERGEVWVQHTVGGVATTTGPEVDESFVGRVGFQRSIRLKAGEMSVFAARSLARTYLQYHSRERYLGQITIGPDDVLLAPGGRPVPGYLARAGQWVQVGDYPPLVIVVQEHNANQPRTRLHLGEIAATYDSRVAATMRDVALQKMGTNPVGGRLR